MEFLAAFTEQTCLTWGLNDCRRTQLANPQQHRAVSKKMKSDMSLCSESTGKILGIIINTS